MAQMVEFVPVKSLKNVLRKKEYADISIFDYKVFRPPQTYKTKTENVFFKF